MSTQENNTKDLEYGKLSTTLMISFLAMKTKNVLQGTFLS